MAEQAWHYMVVIVDAHSNYRMWNSNERKPLDELGEQGWAVDKVLSSEAGGAASGMVSEPSWYVLLRRLHKL